MVGVLLRSSWLSVSCIGRVADAPAPGAGRGLAGRPLPLFFAGVMWRGMLVAPDRVRNRVEMAGVDGSTAGEHVARFACAAWGPIALGSPRL